MLFIIIIKPHIFSIVFIISQFAMRDIGNLETEKNSKGRIYHAIFA